jgi:hypothetical protein
VKLKIIFCEVMFGLNRQGGPPTELEGTKDAGASALAASENSCIAE